MPSTVNSRPMRARTMERTVPVAFPPFWGGVALFPIVVGVAVAVGVTDGVGLGEGESDGEGVGVGVGEGMSVGMGEGEGAGEGLGVGSAVTVAFGVVLASGWKTLADACGWGRISQAQASSQRKQQANRSVSTFFDIGSPFVCNG